MLPKECPSTNRVTALANFPIKCLFSDDISLKKRAKPRQLNTYKNCKMVNDYVGSKFENAVCMDVATCHTPTLYTFDKKKLYEILCRTIFYIDCLC